jgi:peptide subunit release factor 1 (eRF1)
MAGTVSWDSLRELAGFGARHGCAISVYLDLDPSVSPTAGDMHSRVNSLLDELRDYAEKHGLGHTQREGLRTDIERIRRYLEQEFTREGARGLAIFCAGLDNVWRPLALTDSVPGAAEIGREFYLAPLVPLVGRGEGALIAVVSQEQGRLYRLNAGRLSELTDRTVDLPLKRHDQGGWSQANYQRHFEQLVHGHLRGVAEELDRQVRRLGRPRVVVVCSEDTKAELEALLSSEVRSTVVGWTHAEAHATPSELLTLVRPVLDRWREREEESAIERWREEAGRNGRAASGWEQTLEAASDGRVEVLLYEDGTERSAWQCPECGRAAVEGGNCPLDGTRMEEQEHGLDLAVHQTLGHGGKAWALQRREDLRPVGGIAALLRY